MRPRPIAKRIPELGRLGRKSKPVCLGIKRPDPVDQPYLSMSCSRGKASPDVTTKLRLFADSAGYCQNPDCLKPLFLSIEDKEIHIAEMAHIFSASDSGPRAKVKLSAAERGAYENLILLCPDCHTTIDKAEEKFPDGLVSSWKKLHSERIAGVFGAVEFPTREDARHAICSLLDENRTIFQEYGPLSDSRFNPESDTPKLWRRKIREKILPNNRRLLRLLEANTRHMRSDEVATLNKFKQHVDDFEAKHLDVSDVSGTRFPEEMPTILK
jgi:hypothetical protein